MLRANTLFLNLLVLPHQSVPSYVLARGQKALAAYQRALEKGSTLDKRAKVSLVGQDRAGKTSVGKSLKGEQFNKSESSTNGVKMHKPLKNVDKQPWRNSNKGQERTAYHHKCAVYIRNSLLADTESKQEVTQDKAPVFDAITTQLYEGPNEGQGQMTTDEVTNDEEQKQTGSRTCSNYFN